MMLHERLRALRQQRHLTLHDVAAQSGVSISYLSEIERGALPAVDLLDSIVAVYGLTLSEALCGVVIRQTWVPDYSI